MATAYDYSSSSSDDNLSVSSGLLDFLEDPNLSIDTTRSSVLDFGLDFDLYVLIWQQSIKKTVNLPTYDKRKTSRFICAH